MVLLDIFRKIRYYPRSLALRKRIAVTRSLLNGSQQWHVLDRLGIYGHGTDLLRVDFPPKDNIQPEWGYERPPHPELFKLIDSNLPEQMTLLKSILEKASDYHTWPEKEIPSEPDIPWRINDFLPPFDAAALYGMLLHMRPKRYLEIGSGMSTRVAHLARSKGDFPMEIVSIDPDPRFSISRLCDEVYRLRLEELDSEKFLSLVTPQTVVFFDGSHRSFPGSDVTIFFLNLLPRLPSGCVVHIHDIYLPADYPAHALKCLWSEQYLLAAFLLGGSHRLQVILACAHLAANQEASAILTKSLHTEAFGGCSFWLRII